MVRPPTRLSVWDFPFGHPNALIVDEHAAPAQRFSAFYETSDLAPLLSASARGVASLHGIATLAAVNNDRTGPEESDRGPEQEREST